jgi:hypothetical protein
MSPTPPDTVLLSETKLGRQIKLHLCHRYSGMTLAVLFVVSFVGIAGVGFRKLEKEAATQTPCYA